jgi:hypothetical protein
VRALDCRSCCSTIAPQPRGLLVGRFGGRTGPGHRPHDDGAVRDVRRPTAGDVDDRQADHSVHRVSNLDDEASRSDEVPQVGVRRVPGHGLEEPAALDPLAAGADRLEDLQHRRPVLVLHQERAPERLADERAAPLGELLGGIVLDDVEQLVLVALDERVCVLVGRLRRTGAARRVGVQRVCTFELHVRFPPEMRRNEPHARARFGPPSHRNGAETRTAELPLWWTRYGAHNPIVKPPAVDSYARNLPSGFQFSALPARSQQMRNPRHREPRRGFSSLSPRVCRGRLIDSKSGGVTPVSVRARPPALVIARASPNLVRWVRGARGEACRAGS